MDFSLSEAQHALRAEAAQFAERELNGFLEKPGREPEFDRDVWQRCADFGVQGSFVAPEHGGRGRDVPSTVLLLEGIGYGCRDNGLTLGLNGHIWAVTEPIVKFGSPEQHERYLPKIFSGEEFWCQLFSETEAGSDLANLATTAVLDGDEYVVNGSKIWSSGAHGADMGILIARTDPDAPKHKGISYFLCPMDTPGLTMSPIVDMTTAHSFNQVFFDDVRIPVDMRVGQEGDGWRLAKATLANERVGLSEGGVLWGSGPSAFDFLDLARSARVSDDPLAQIADVLCAADSGRLEPLRGDLDDVGGQPVDQADDCPRAQDSRVDPSPRAGRLEGLAPELHAVQSLQLDQPGAQSVVDVVVVVRDLVRHVGDLRLDARTLAQLGQGDRHARSTLAGVHFFANTFVDFAVFLSPFEIDGLIST